MACSQLRRCEGLHFDDLAVAGRHADAVDLKSAPPGDEDGSQGTGCQLFGEWVEVGKVHRKRKEFSPEPAQSSSAGASWPPSNHRQFSGFPEPSTWQDPRGLLLQGSRVTVGVQEWVGDKLHVCRYCRRSFASFRALGGHMNGHKKERQLELEECGPSTPHLTSSGFQSVFSGPARPAAGEEARFLLTPKPPLKAPFCVAH